jgi:hypothetical protein
VPCSASSWYWVWLRSDGQGTSSRAGAESARERIALIGTHLEIASSCGRAVGGRLAIRPAQAVRRVPAASFEAGHRLEVQTGRSTVVIFANDPAPVAEQLQGLTTKFRATWVYLPRRRAR